MKDAIGTEIAGGSGARPADVVAFWRAAGEGRWFGKDPHFDGECRTHFLSLHMAVAERRHDGWIETPGGALALVLLTDQIPRNIFRGTAHMYATDSLARHYARRALAARVVEQADPELRGFFYLPFEHSEAIDDQDLSVALSTGLGSPWLTYAQGHRDIIRRFGRFPHRNPLLGRDTTEEEAAFMASGGFAG